MCGLFAMFGEAFAEDFRAGLAALRSRGPDEEGRWEEAGVCLGHRRLSVIDLASGQQPMTLAAGHPAHERYRVVYNGEIYNFKELREELVEHGHRFETQSDTEVLLAGYVEWGEAVLPRLDGMFGFVVYDRAERKVFAARDRFGIKPLFYSEAGGGLTVSSTVEPFFRLRGFPRELDYAAIGEFLACQSIGSPRSVLRSIRSLPPGCCLRWSAAGGAAEVSRYWELLGPSEPVEQPSLEAFVESTDTAMRESVRRQLVADVPLGAFLSGGIDSSLMVHYMSEAGGGPTGRTVSGGGGIKTFSVRFPFGKGYDESGPAAAVARQYGCEHHVLDAGEVSGEVLRASVAGLDQPMADPAYLPTLMLAELTRGSVTVAVSGDGGDEMFGGYGRYTLTEDRYPDSPGRRAVRGLVRGRLLPRAMSRRGLAGRERMLWDRVKLGSFPGTRKDLGSLLRADAMRQVVAAGGVMETWRAMLARFAEDGVVGSDALMRADVWTYLSENCLVKTDRASMAHGLEVRVPMLGNPVAEAALPVHASVKMAGTGKAALVALAKRYLPPEVWDRPKHGFSVPLRGYFGGAWREVCEDWMARCGELAPFLDARAVERRWRGGGDARTLYTLIVLLGWLDSHDVSC
ncbi:MAG: asparagine synthase (glutamine-hydrolyzing) [Planctomycetota bacterium]